MIREIYEETGYVVKNLRGETDWFLQEMVAVDGQEWMSYTGLFKVLEKKEKLEKDIVSKWFATEIGDRGLPNVRDIPRELLWDKFWLIYHHLNRDVSHK